MYRNVPHESRLITTMVYDINLNKAHIIIASFFELNTSTRSYLNRYLFILIDLFIQVYLAT